MEKDNETFSGAYDFGARIMDVRLGRWMSVDPLYTKTYSQSTYCFAWNIPIMIGDLDGNEGIVTVQKDANGGGKIIISSIVYVTGKEASAEIAKTLNTHFSTIAKGGTYIENGNEFTLEFQVEFKYEPDRSKIDLKTGENIIELSGDPCRSHAGIGGSGGIVRSKNGDGEWVTTYIPPTTGNEAKVGTGHGDTQTITHELLHLFGLSDRYTDVPLIVPGRSKEDAKTITTSVPHQGWDGDIMANGTNFSQHHVDNFCKFILGQGRDSFTLNQFVDLDEKLNLIPESK
jgi:RHS repeat-associated protein